MYLITYPVPLRPVWAFSLLRAFINKGLVKIDVDTEADNLSFATGVDDAKGLMGNGESRSLLGIAVTVEVPCGPADEGKTPDVWSWDAG